MKKFRLSKLLKTFGIIKISNQEKNLITHAMFFYQNYLKRMEILPDKSLSERSVVGQEIELLHHFMRWFLPEVSDHARPQLHHKKTNYPYSPKEEMEYFKRMRLSN